MTATALAAKVGLTVAPCHRRLRDLEQSGVIRGYRADIDPSAVGLGFEAQVTVDSNRIKGVSGPLRYLVAVFQSLRSTT